MKVGIFGGTFNPPHMGHLIIAERVRADLELSKIVFVPSFISPHKQDREIASGEERLMMLRLAIGGDTRYEVSDLELRRGGVSYTVETLAEMARTLPGDELFFLLGMDNLIEFDTWKDPQRITELATIVVMTRPGFARPDRLPVDGLNLIYCDVPEIAISSTEIRRRIQGGDSIRFLLPEAVEEYIRGRGLYR
jgi:nicotinate-nucleotide adenylyltransferase